MEANPQEFTDEEVRELRNLIRRRRGAGKASPTFLSIREVLAAAAELGLYERVTAEDRRVYEAVVRHDQMRALVANDVTESQLAAGWGGLK